MKRIIAVLLAMFVCFPLAGCGSKEQQIQTEQQIVDRLPETEELTDPEGLASQTTVERPKEQQTEQQAQQEALQEELSSQQGEEQPEMSEMQDEQQPLEDLTEESSYVAEGSSPDGTFKEYYENGLLLKRETAMDNGTNVEEFFDENGKMIREVRTNPDGSYDEAEFNDKGKPLSTVTVTAEGVRIESHHEYYENGNQKDLYSLSDEEERRVTYYESGSRESDLRVSLDGSCLEQRFAENGTMIYSFDRKPGGDYVKWTYSEDGTLLSRENSISGEVSVVTYRADGTMAEEYVYCTDGTVWHNVFDANGHQILEASGQVK